jgi:hypothetical protein
MPPGDAQLALPFDAPPVPLDVRLRTMGLRDVAAIRTHRNRSVLVSLTRRGVLRIHADYAGAPDGVIAAIVRFLGRGVPSAERRRLLEVMRAWPLSSPAGPRRRVATASPAPADARALAKLAARWHELNAMHFGGSLREIPIGLSGRMRRRLGHLVYDRATSAAVEIVLRRRFVHRAPWGQVEETLLHEMVHQWQAETGRAVDHGREFRRKAREVGITPRAVADLTA